MARSEGGGQKRSPKGPKLSSIGSPFGPQIGAEMGPETKLILKRNLAPSERSILNNFLIWDFFTITLCNERVRNRKWPDPRGARKGFPKGPKLSPIGSPFGSPNRSRNQARNGAHFEAQFSPSRGPRFNKIFDLGLFYDYIM